MNRAMRRWLGLGMFALVAAAFSGCKSSDELTGTPWNRPQNWESGLPSAMTEGR